MIPQVLMEELASPMSEVPTKPPPVSDNTEKILHSSTLLHQPGMLQRNNSNSSAQPEPSGNSPVHKLSSKPWLPCSHPGPNSHSVGGWEAP